MMNNIRSVWEQQSNSLKNEVIQHRLADLPVLICHIGTVSVTRVRFFSLEIEAGTTIPRHYLRRFAGVEVQLLPLKNNKEQLMIMLLEEELMDIFILFIEDIIAALKLAENTEEGLTIIGQRIQYWKRLFGKFSLSGLTPQQQRGLFGELFFLKKLLEERTEKAVIINGWQGPLGTNQDFYFHENAAEVKTSKANNPGVIIASEFQLDIAGYKNLLLVFYKINELPNPDKEATLTGMIQQIRTLLEKSGDALHGFNQKLQLAGIDPDAEENYTETGYTVTTEHYFQVTKDFPKITSATIDEAISNVSYRIALRECRDFEISFTDCLKILFP